MDGLGAELTFGFCLQAPGKSHVVVGGELDRFGAPDLVDFVAFALTSGHDLDLSTVVLDLEHLTFIDAGGIRALVVMDQRVREAGATLVIEHASGHLLRLLTIVGLDTVLHAVPATAAGPLSRC